MVKNSSKIIVTTSWDDAHPANFNLVELLNKYNLKGTFYLDKNNHSIGQIKTISSTHEIGSHSLTHADLTKLDLAFARKEIIESKKWLERTTGQPIKMFAYPFGFYNEEIKKLIRQAGFVGARTTKEFCFEKPNDFFEWGTTLHIYPFPLRKRDKNYLHLSRFLFQPFGQKLFKILKLGLPLNSFFNWSNLAKNLFDYFCQNKGVYHLWGHSWEIEKYGLWQDLEEIFKYISGRKNILYLTNSQVLEIK